MPTRRTSSPGSTAFSKPHGGTGAYDRKDHPSDAFLDSELDQLKAMAQVIPPIFLFIAAFLVNMILSRLIALEREQIGLLKAVGYANQRLPGTMPS
jgi:putative ABC transport system permease protein